MDLRRVGRFWDGVEPIPAQGSKVLIKVLENKGNLIFQQGNLPVDQKPGCYLRFDLSKGSLSTINKREIKVFYTLGSRLRKDKLELSLSLQK